MAAVARAEENGYANASCALSRREVDLSDYRDFADALCQIGRLLRMCIITSASIHPWIPHPG